MIPLKWRVAVVIFVLVLSLSSLSVLKNRQLHFMRGMAEEYFGMGVNIYYYGKMSPRLLGARIIRPPGYPVFIAAVLRIWGGLPENILTYIGPEFDQKRQEAYQAVCLAQSMLLSLSSVILFLFMAKFFRLRNAAVLATLFGCNPYMIILTGLIHYEMFHVFLTIVSMYSLSSALNIGSERPAGLKMILPGVFWGFTTLVRPLTLILPAFAVIIFLIKFKRSWRALLDACVFFTLGMGLIIIANTTYNYTLTGRIIPVNAQGGIASWAGTVKKLERHPNHYRWWQVWDTEGMKIYQKITRNESYYYSVYLKHLLELEDEFRKEAVKNLRLRPDVYVHNFWTNLLTFNLDINSVFIKIFRVIQDPNIKMDKRWLQVGNPQDFYASSQADAFKYYIHLLTLFGFLGIGIALIQKDNTILVPGLVYLCFCFAHSMTYMDLMYYYIKIPFLYIFTGYFINAIDRDMITIPFLSRQISPAFILNVLMIVIGIWLTGVIILG